MKMVVCEIFKSSARIFCSKHLQLFDAVLVPTDFKLFHNLKMFQKETRIFVTVSASIIFLVYVKLDCEIWNKFKVRRWSSPFTVQKRHAIQADLFVLTRFYSRNIYILSDGNEKSLQTYTHVFSLEVRMVEILTDF